jgi:epoxyqueuosine reductase
MSSRPDRIVRERAKALGFFAVGVASAREDAAEDFGRYQAFIRAGMHGQMQYLARAGDARRRIDTPAILEGARSVVCVADGYDARAGERDGVAPLIAAYARGRDYHNHMRKRLRKLAAFIRALGPGVRARPMCDDAPVLERAWAARSGIGFIGKNGMLIVPGGGSFVLLGEVVTTLDLAPDAAIGRRCGRCTRCLDACPTRALVAPFVLDARRCVSYLTVEARGAFPEDLRSKVGEHLFGCDDCQSACPYNARRAEPVRPQYASLPRWRETSLEALVDLGDEAHRDLVAGTPVRRVERAGLARNAIAVLASRRQPRYRALLERAAKSHPDGPVREHALWGLDLLAGPKSR